MKTREHLKNDEADNKIQEWLTKKFATKQARNERMQQNQIRLPVIGTLSIANPTEQQYDGDEDEENNVQVGAISSFWQQPETIPNKFEYMTPRLLP